MRDLLILGTSVHALEMVEIVERVNRVTPTWNLLGFITRKKQAGLFNAIPVMGTLADLSRYPSAALLPDVGARRWAEISELPRERMASLIDPSVFISRTATLGCGCVLYPHGFVGLNVKMGDFVFCLSGCVINHDDVLADRVDIASHVVLAGYVQVGADTYLGQGCHVRQNLKIGAHCMIGMGAVVVKDVPDNSVMAGNPARKIRENVKKKEQDETHAAP